MITIRHRPAPPHGSPDYDPEAHYMTLDEIMDAQADDAERQWRESNENNE